MYSHILTLFCSLNGGDPVTMNDECDRSVHTGKNVQAVYHMLFSNRSVVILR